MTSGSDRKSNMARVGWLYGLLPAKRERKHGGSDCQSHPLCQQFDQSGKSPDALKQIFGSMHDHNICTVFMLNERCVFSC